jgi:hypothetical protein
MARELKEKTMKIPYKFELMGKTIVVRFVTELLQESDALGQACYRTGEIKILDNSPTYKITEDQQFSQWGSCHEKCFDGLMGSLKRKHGKLTRPEQWTPAEIRDYRLCAIGGKHEKHRNDGDRG